MPVIKSIKRALVHVSDFVIALVSLIAAIVASMLTFALIIVGMIAALIGFLLFVAIVFPIILVGGSAVTLYKAATRS